MRIRRTSSSWKASFSAVYQNSPLGFPIIGTRENLASMTSDTLRAYMQAHYVAENMVVGISGSFDDAVENLLCETFAKIRRAPVPGFQPAQYVPADSLRKNRSSKTTSAWASAAYPRAIPTGMRRRFFRAF